MLLSTTVNVGLIMINYGVPVTTVESTITDAVHTISLAYLLNVRVVNMQCAMPDYNQIILVMQDSLTGKNQPFWR